MIISRSFWNAFDTKDSTNGKEPIGAPRIRTMDSSVRKPRGSDINWFNVCGNQATHFVDCNESLNVPNFSYNRKKIGSTFEVRLIMHISFTN
jgi:hypothetical protein